MNKIIRIANIILFAIFPIQFLYFKNQAFIHDGGLAIPLLIVSAGATLIYWILNLINTKNNNNVLIVVLISLWFLLYGHVYYFLLDAFHIHYTSFRHRYYFPIYSLLFFIPIWKLLK